MSEETVPRRDRRVVLLLWLLPLWLVVSTVVGILLYFHRQAEAGKVEQIRFTTGVSAEGLKDDVGKFLSFVGQRHTGDPDAAKGLNRAAAMIEGSLGPGNAGYKVERLPVRSAAAGSWPILMTTVRGKDPKLDPLWVLAAYDARPASLGAEANASGVASVLAAARAMANAAPQRGIVFAFLPHAYDPAAPLKETFEALQKRIGIASELLVVEATGAKDKLLVSSADARSKALSLTKDLGETASPDSIRQDGDFDLSSRLAEIGLPAVRVATRPLVRSDDSDSAAPDPATHAAATKALVTLIGRLSDS